MALFGRKRAKASEDAPEILRLALAADRAAGDRLAKALLPHVQQRIARVLLRGSQGAAVSRQEVLDLVQETMAALFAADMRILRTWDPRRGAPLESFVALVAERVVYSVKRSGRRGGWREELAVDGLVDEERAVEVDIEVQVASREILERLLDRLRAELSPRGMAMFRALYIDSKSLDEVARENGMTMNALYTWRSRLRASLAVWQQELESSEPARKTAGR